MSKPIAVLISDVHYSLNTMRRAWYAMRDTIYQANSLEVPLIVTGDLHDTKANLRGECVSQLIDIFKWPQYGAYIISGNHDRINEKSPDHSLEFLRPYATIVDKPTMFRNWLMLPYYSDVQELRALLRASQNTHIMMHQGVAGGNSGHYIQDKSALSIADLAGRTEVISGHYHYRQTFDIPNGTLTYLGNPYTLGFGEANDPEKGYHVLYDDGRLKFYPLVCAELPQHRVLEFTTDDLTGTYHGPVDGILLVKMKGPKSELDKLTKMDIDLFIGKTGAYRLEFIPDATEIGQLTKSANKTDLLDLIIDAVKNADSDQKRRLKALWRDLK